MSTDALPAETHSSPAPSGAPTVDLAAADAPAVGEPAEASDLVPRPPGEPGEPAGEEPAGEPAGEPAPAGAATRLPRWAVLALVAMFVLTVAMAAVTAATVSPRNDEAASRRELERVAGGFAAAIYTYDYRDLPATKRRVLSYATGAFRRDYDRTFGRYEELFETVKGQATATVTDVFVGAVEDDTATAIVSVDTTVSGIAGTRRHAGYTQLDLVRVQGRWRVDGVQVLYLGDDALGVPAPSAGAPEPGAAPPGGNSSG